MTKKELLKSIKKAERLADDFSDDFEDEIFCLYRYLANVGPLIENGEKEKIMEGLHGWDSVIDWFREWLCEGTKCLKAAEKVRYEVGVYLDELNKEGGK